MECPELKRSGDKETLSISLSNVILPQLGRNSSKGLMSSESQRVNFGVWWMELLLALHPPLSPFAFTPLIRLIFKGHSSSRQGYFLY